MTNDAKTVSVMIPTRGRPEQLIRAVRSLMQLATRPADVEILVRFDDDDPTRREAAAVDDVENVRTRTGKRGRGYQDLDSMYNELAAESKGDVIVLWNDDTEVVTPGWDALLCAAPIFSIQELRRDSAPKNDFTFPTMGRPIYEAMGHFSRNPYNDVYVGHIGLYTGTCILRDDIQFHHHCLDDQTAAEKEATGIEKFTNYHGAEQREERTASMARILAAPGYAARFSGHKMARTPHLEQLPYNYVVVDGNALKPYTYRIVT